MSTPDSKPTSRVVIGLAAGVLFILFWALGSGSILNTDDAIYAQMARESFQAGEWFNFSWLGTVLYEKPPLLFWLLQCSGSVLGFDALAMQLPAAFGGLVACIFLFKIARQQHDSEPIAAVSVILLVSSFLFLWMSRRVMTDTLLMASSLAVLWFSFSLRNRPSYKSSVFLGCAGGLGVLAKSIALGPVLLGVLPFVLRRELLKYVSVAFGVALAVAAPWHVVMTLEHGSSFWSTYLGYHVVERAQDTLVGGNDAWYYLNTFIQQEGLLGLTLFVCTGLGVMRAFKERSQNMLCIALVLLIQLVVIHLMQTRLFHYLLPSIPLMVILTVYGLGRWIQDKRYMFGLAAVACASFFMGSAQVTFGSSEPSVYAKISDRFIEQTDSKTELILFNTYAPSLFWESARKGAFWTDQDEAYSRLQAIAMLRQAGAVVKADPDKFSALKKSGHPWMLIMPRGENKEVTLHQLSKALGVTPQDMKAHHQVREAFGHWIIASEGGP